VLVVRLYAIVLSEGFREKLIVPQLLRDSEVDYRIQYVK
jgi:hypothetical protein